MKKLLISTLLGGGILYLWYRAKTNALDKLTVNLKKLKFLSISGSNVVFEVTTQVVNPTGENLYIPNANGKVSTGNKVINTFTAPVGVSVSRESTATLPIILSIPLASFIAAGIDIVKNGLNNKLLFDFDLFLGPFTIPVRQEFDFTLQSQPQTTTNTGGGATAGISTPTIVDPFALNNPSQVLAANLNGEVDATGGILITATQESVEAVRPGTPQLVGAGDGIVEVELSNGSTAMLMPQEFNPVALSLV